MSSEKQSDIDKFIEHEKMLNNLKGCVHRFVMREYIKAKFASTDASQTCKDLGFWDEWKEQKDALTPEWDKIKEVAKALYKVFDKEEYQEFHVQYHVNIAGNNLDAEPLGPKLDRLEKENKQLQARCKKLCRQVEKLLGRIETPHHRK